MNSIADLLGDRPLPSAQPQTSTSIPAAVDTNINPIQSTKIDTDKLSQLKTIAYALKDQLDALIRVLNGEQIDLARISQPDGTTLSSGERVIEGVFNGLKMVGPDGKEYPVPPNYASKSKLVEGDMMKLTITTSGSFIFKQIGPTKRKRITGELVGDEAGAWRVLCDGKPYKILTASVTFYKAKPGDDIVILVPEDGHSEWGAVEHIISKQVSQQSLP